MVEKQKLLEFISLAHKNMYPAPAKIRRKYKCNPIQPGHKDYDFTHPDFPGWRCHDSYAGWSWPPGKEVVFYEDKPVWAMSYQGKRKEDLSDDFTELTYAFLKAALLSFEPTAPFRGPRKFKNPEHPDFNYTFNFQGDYSYFKGRESVTHKGEEVFFQDIMGTLIK